MKKTLFYFTGFLVLLFGFYLFLPLLQVKPIPIAEIPESSWKPNGFFYREKKSTILGKFSYFRTMHSDTVNSDEVYGVVAPRLKLDWHAESDYIAEGPTFDDSGNIYYSPISGKDSILISLDGKTGKRRWALPGKNSGGGAPLILYDPENGKQVVYSGFYEEAFALTTDGTVIWRVQTGLTHPPIEEGVPNYTHNFGLNYHPQSDSVIGLLMDGHVFAMDRRTGRPLLAKPFLLPGERSAPEKVEIGPFLIKRTDRLMNEVFGETKNKIGRFSFLLDVLFGGGVKVANYFSIDPNTGRIFIAATAPDDADGKKDGLSEYGSLYALEIIPGSPHSELKIVHSVSFQGGSGSTPALAADGSRVYVADNDGNLIAYDRDLREIWKISLGEQIAASISVARDNRELYAVSSRSLFKVIDGGEKGKLVWVSSIDAYPQKFGQENFNLLTATIAENGIAVSAGSGYRIGKRNAPLPLTMGVGLLDRETGKLRYFTEGVEESIAVTTVGPDGGIYLAHSPVRRALARALLGRATAPLSGGVAKYMPLDSISFLKDALKAAIHRSELFEISGEEYHADKALFLWNQAKTAFTSLDTDKIAPRKNEIDILLDLKIVSSAEVKINSQKILKLLEEEGK